MTSAQTREEVDSMGPLDVNADRYWGAQTERSLHYFRIGAETVPLELIRAIATIKKAAALVHRELGLLPESIATAIADAADEIIAGQYDREFPLSVWQTGSGTQTHMNVNEVIAGRANERLTGTRGGKKPVHPNDHVNMGQSTNDVFPTAIHLAVISQIDAHLLPAVRTLRDTLAQKAELFFDVVKIGRTHLQDATPLSLGQEISGWVSQIDHGLAMIMTSLAPLHELALGGTAVGTGLNSHPEFAARAILNIATATGRLLVPAENRFQALASHDAILFSHGALRTLAASLLKIANDVRWLSSGPRCGIGEIIIPANEPGSSIMPGKVNPTQCEALIMVCLQVFGNDASLAIAGSSGNFELNTCQPLIAHLVLQSIRLIAEACTSFERHCARGIEPNRIEIAAKLQRSLMLVTALVPHVGYDAAARLALYAQSNGDSLRDAAVELGLLSGEEYDDLVRPDEMLGVTEK